MTDGDNWEPATTQCLDSIYVLRYHPSGAFDSCTRLSPESTGSRATSRG